MSVAVTEERRVLSIEDYLEDVRHDRHFSCTKINHGFWERLIRIREMSGGELDLESSLEAEIRDKKTGTPCLISTGFVKELFELIANIPSLSGDFRFAASPYAWPACRRIFGVPWSGLREVENIIHQYIPPHISLEDGLFWKTAILDGSMVDFFALLRTKRVVVVGPRWLKNFGLFGGFDDFTFIEIDEKKARCERDDILRRITEYAKETTDKSTVYLLQGGPVATWLVLKLHGKLQNSTLIDMGLALNLCAISMLPRQEWSRFYRGRVAKTIQRIHSGWENLNEAYFEINDKAEQQRVWQTFSSGVETAIAEIAGLPPRSEYDPEIDFPALEGAVSSFEHKKIDTQRVEEILEFSSQYSVITMLERSLEYMMGVPQDRAVVICSSASAALLALVGLHTLKQGRPLRVIASAYGVSAALVAHSGTTVTLVDCDQTGLLDINLLNNISPDSYDALLVTNVFGLSSDIKQHREFCQVNKKILLVDNSATLIDYERTITDAPDEIISFHHSLPWGVSDGGALVIARTDAQIVRGFFDNDVAAYVTKANMSDLTAASILERLERYSVWSDFYRAQYTRIYRLANHIDSCVLGIVNPKRLYATLPLFAHASIAVEGLGNLSVPIHKAYQSATIQDAPVANSLYEKIITIPTHSGMAALPTDLIAEMLYRIRNGVIS